MRSAILRIETASYPSLTKSSRAASRMARATVSRSRSWRSLTPKWRVLSRLADDLMAALNGVYYSNAVRRLEHPHGSGDLARLQRIRAPGTQGARHPDVCCAHGQ